MSEKKEYVPIGYADVQVRLRVVAPDGWWQNAPVDLNMCESPEQIYQEATRDAVDAFRKRMESVSSKVPGGAAKVQVCHVERLMEHEADELPSETANFNYESWDE